MSFGNLQAAKDEEQALIENLAKLTEQVQILGLEKERLDGIVSDHEASKLKNSELTTTIAEKEKIVSDLEVKIKELTTEAGEKEKIAKEIEDLKAVKTELDEEIPYKQSILRVIQNEIKVFQEGKEKIINQTQEKTDIANHKLFLAEEKIKDVKKTLQLFIETLN